MICKRLFRAATYFDGFRLELLFVLLFAYLRKIKSEKLQKMADAAAAKAKQTMPVIAK